MNAIRPFAIGGRMAAAVLMMVALLSVASARSVKAATPVPAYVVTSLGTLGGSFCSGFTGQNSFATAVNESGHAAGGSCKFFGFFQPAIGAFARTSGAPLDLGVAGAAYGINDAGEIVGGSGSPDFEASGTAFVWRAGVLTSLGPVLGGFSRAFDINNLGQVVGLRGSGAIDRWRAFRYDSASGVVTDLGTLGGTFRSTATAANDVGQIAGWASLANENTFHAFRWDHGVMTDLGTLGGQHSFAHGLNVDGHVVGHSWVSGGEHAFLWHDGVMTDLGTLGGSSSVAWGINDRGDVVGAAATSAAGTHAFVWQNGEMRDLNDLVAVDSGWMLREARAINSRGQIVGTGRFAGEERAFLLTPVADVTAPTLVVPDDVTVAATGSGGVVVTYAASATDDSDPHPAITCTPPSGAIFPIGTTSVTCTATDASGNTASESFDVHVTGAAEQLASLALDVSGLGPGTSLIDKLRAAQVSLGAGDLRQACAILTAFGKQVAAQAGKTLTGEQAETLAVRSTRIKAVLAC